MRSTKKQNDQLQIGDIIIEKRAKKKRIGEIIFIREGKARKLELIELNRHDLSPICKCSMEGPKVFSRLESECRKMNLFRFEKKKTFELGDIIKFTIRSKSKFGIVTSFIHPDGLYSESFEKGYNGKDFLECIEVFPKQGLPRRKDSNNKPFTFLATGERSKVCVVIPMDKEGGVRLKERAYSYSKKDARQIGVRP